ncbi:hypothetical protein O3P69_018493 [Scylla paramamosain]|uniref:Uncharacterized protein n=1 Tax=Scylla paramamosain TaxID=85552 RepID=A0AAW0T1D2_SCYPA
MPRAPFPLPSYYAQIPGASSLPHLTDTPLFPLTPSRLPGASTSPPSPHHFSMALTSLETCGVIPCERQRLIRIRWRLQEFRSPQVVQQNNKRQRERRQHETQHGSTRDYERQRAARGGTGRPQNTQLKVPSLAANRHQPRPLSIRRGGSTPPQPSPSTRHNPALLVSSRTAQRLPRAGRG